MNSRNVIAALCVSGACIASIAGYECFMPTAYLPTKNDVPTIGYGHTKGVKMGDTVTKERALEWLKKDADVAAVAVRKCVKVPLYQYEFDSLVHFTMNVGSGALCKSTLVKKFNRGDYTGGCKGMSQWVYQKGKVLPGLVKRRKHEVDWCLGKLEKNTQLARTKQ